MSDERLRECERRYLATKSSADWRRWVAELARVGRGAVWSSPPAHRPPHPLPSGVSYSEEPGQYLHDQTGILLLWVPAGSFRMGCSDDYWGLRASSDERPLGDEGPVHEVHLTQGFFIAKFPTTWEQFQAWRAATRRRALKAPRFAFQGAAYDERHPVVNVSWDQAQDFCVWAGVRLPTEAEWEWTARGADGRRWPWGNEKPTPERLVSGAHPRFGYKSTAPVGTCPAGASPWGALDMAGNVWEWVMDYYTEYPDSPQTDPGGPVTEARDQRTTRGGSWSIVPRYCRATSRYPRRAGLRSRNDLGFRVALSPSHMTDTTRRAPPAPSC